jgi:hypothetical protein
MKYITVTYSNILCSHRILCLKAFDCSLPLLAEPGADQEAPGSAVEQKQQLGGDSLLESGLCLW